MGFCPAHIPAALLLETMNSIITQRQHISIYLAIQIHNLFRVAQSAAMVTVTTKFQQSTWAHKEILHFAQSWRDGNPGKPVCLSKSSV